MTRQSARTSRVRQLHPGAWWGWAFGCVIVVSRTTNPIVLCLLICVIVFVQACRHTQAPWALAFRLYVWVAVFVFVLRIAFRIIFSADGPTVLVRLPLVTLPGVLSSVRLFGPVSAEALLGATQSALQLVAMILAIGAANALANPKRLLSAVPSALYEWGTVVVIAISVFPQLAESVVRVRRARQLRAETGRSVHLIKTVAMPVLADAMDRSLLLAGAMDSKGYGRSGLVAVSSRRATSALILLSALAMCVGAYGVLDTGNMPAWLGLPMIGVGLLAGIVALRVAGRRVIRTRYRPDRMLGAEWVVLGCGVVGAVMMAVIAHNDPTTAFPSFQPLAWPTVSLACLLAVVILAVPAFIVPRTGAR